MVALTNKSATFPECPLRVRALNHRYRLGASRCSKPNSQANLCEATYAECDRLGSCSKDPIGFRGSRFGLYWFLNDSPLHTLDFDGLQTVVVGDEQDEGDSEDGPTKIDHPDKLPCRDKTTGPTTVRVCVRPIRDPRLQKLGLGGHIFLRVECGGAAEDWTWTAGPGEPDGPCKEKCGKKDQLVSWIAKFAPRTKENPLGSDYPLDGEKQFCTVLQIDKSPKDILDCLLKFAMASKKCCVPYDFTAIGDPAKGCNSNCFAYWAASSCFQPILEGKLDLPPGRPKPTPGWGKDMPKCIKDSFNNDVFW